MSASSRRGWRRALTGILATSVAAAAGSAVESSRLRDEVDGPASAVVVDETRPAFGVGFRIVLAGGDRAAASGHIESAFALLAELETLFDHWDSASAIHVLNRDPSSDWVAVDARLAEAVGLAVDFGRASGGALDITIAPVLRELGFYGDTPAPATGSAPPAERVGLEWIDARADPPAVRRRRSGFELDLSALSKGYAVDRTVEHLRTRGVTNALVAAGTSTVYGLGPGPDGDGWPFQVPAAQGRAPARTWRLRDEAAATSGKFSQPLEREGRPISHIIDPRTRDPVIHATRMTVFRAPTAAEADMGSTALLVMGAEEARAWMEARPEWARGRAARLYREGAAEVVELGGR